MNDARACESGQVLIVSLGFLVFASIICLYFFSFVESTQRLSLQEMTLRENSLSQASTVANLLNTIAINNTAIIASLGAIGGVWQEGASWSFAAAMVHPYWEQGPFSTDKKTEEIIKKIFSTMDMRTGRSFLIAKALSNENKKKVLELGLYAPKLGSLLFRISNEQTFCLAIAMAADNNKMADNILGALKFFKKLFFPQIYTKNCAIFSDDTNIAAFGNKFTAQHNEDDFFGFYAPKNANELKYFSQNLLISNKQIYSNNSQFNSHSKLRDFFINLLFKKSALNSVFKKKKSDYLSAIIHPNIILGNKCDTRQKTTSNGKINVNIFTVADFNKINNCGISSPNALRAFFYPAWAPIIVGRKVYE